MQKEGFYNNRKKNNTKYIDYVLMFLYYIYLGLTYQNFQN